MSKHKKKTTSNNKLINLKNTKDDLGNKTFDSTTHDSFVNFMARLGLQADNLHNQSQYSLGPFISRNRLMLEAAYRDSWIVGKTVDCIAEDMTKEGCSFYSKMKPDDIKKIQATVSKLDIWHSLCSGIKWGRLYGGAIAVILIDGADYSTPLDVERVGKGKFKGLVVLDRWMLQPSVTELITEIGIDIGKPKYYEALSGITIFPGEKIHHSRCIRFDGIEMPYYQKLFENLWGISVIERMYDRLLAFDSATTGAAQLVYKAYLRVIGVKGLREALATGGKEEIAVIKQFEYMRQMQNNEGITLLDSEDIFNTHQYSFAGLDDLLAQFGQQISGAIDIPLVRLFGQSPKGFSTGDTDLRNYYDYVGRLQENQLRKPCQTIFSLISMSELSRLLPDDFEFDFVSLWQLSETEKSTIAQTDSNTIGGAFESGTISKSTALKELVQSSRVTGRFSNITEEDIKEAENEPPSSAGLMEQEKQSEVNNPEEDKEEIESKITSIPAKDGRSRLFSKVLDAIKEYKRKFKDSDYLESEFIQYYKEFTIRKKKNGVMFYVIKKSEQVESAESLSEAKRRIDDLLKTKDSDFNEEEHPRVVSGETAGQFVKKGEGGRKEEEQKETEESLNFKEQNPDIKPKMFEVNKLKESIQKWDRVNYEMNKSDKQKVDKLVDLSKEDFKKLPPVIIERYTKEGGWKIIDGWHRLSASLKRGDVEEINALVKDMQETKDETSLNTMFKPSESTAQPLNSEKRIKYQGVDIIIENSKGTIRKGVDESGNYFEIKLPADYGFIEGYLGNDGQDIDCFIGENKDSDLVVIIKQRNIVTGGFDEEKVIFGCDNKEEATKLYVSAFDNSDEARSRIIEVAGMDIKTFKDMLNGGIK